MKVKIFVFSLAAACSLCCQAPSRAAETLQGDRQWEAAVTNGPCQGLRDRYTDSPSDVAACKALYASQPPCTVYRNYAQIWFDMRTSRDPALHYLSHTLDSLGSATDPNIADKKPEFRLALQRLLAATLNADLSGRDSKKWSQMAYERCMENKPL